MKQNLWTALLIGRDYGNAWVLPSLLARAGFEVDAISSSWLMKRCKFVRRCDLVPLNDSLIPAIRNSLQTQYDWIIITEDRILTEVLTSDLSLEEKLRILPVLKEENFSHLYSKIGLSEVFTSGAVSTPPSSIARNRKEALEGASQLDYPVLIKRDSSGGGAGVFECLSPSDIERIPNEVFQEPVVVQKKLTGIEVDLSALYLSGELIHFNYAKVERVTLNKFGPSALRTYRPLHAVDRQIFEELSHIGRVLGAHGFINMGSLLSNGQRCFFEADMRPNAWVDFTRFIGDDPAIRIHNWFSHREKLSYPVDRKPNQPTEILVPYFLRLKRWEFLVNRFGTWNYMPWEDPRFVFLLLMKRFFHPDPTALLIRIVKRIVPESYHAKLRALRYRLIGG